MKRNRSFYLVATLALLGMAVIWQVVACGGDDDDDSTTTETDVTWNSFAQGFMNDYCVKCHSNPPQNDAPFSLTTYADVVDEAHEVEEEVEEGAMPPEGPFPSQVERDKLVEWIEAGAPEN